MIHIFINDKSVIFIQKVFNGVFPLAQSNCASFSQILKIMTNLSKFSTPNLHPCKLVNNLATLKMHSISICEPKNTKDLPQHNIYIWKPSWIVFYRPS